MATAHAERLPKERLVPHLLAKITSSLQRTLWIKAMKKREQKEKERRREQANGSTLVGHSQGAQLVTKITHYPNVTTRSQNELLSGSASKRKTEEKVKKAMEENEQLRLEVEKLKVKRKK